MSTIGRARYRYDRGYDVTSAATVRVIGEMKQPAPTMSAVIPTGQSGNPFSPHYGDQVTHWLKGDSLPIADAAESVDGSTLTLSPAQ